MVAGASVLFLAERLVQQGAGVRWRGCGWFPASRRRSGLGDRRPARRLPGCRRFASERGGRGDEPFDLDERDAAPVDVGGLPDVERPDDGWVGHRDAPYPGRALMAP